MPEQAIYERQNLIGDLDIPEVASVVGCGGTGFWTALFLAMSGVEELILVDSDIVEVSNLNRLLLEESQVGKKKSGALKDLILSIRKEMRIEIQDMRIEKPIDCQILRGEVFCCTDNLQSQQVICAFCRKNSLPYQRTGYDGTILNVSKTFPLSFKEAGRQGGYTVTPSWVIPAVFAAAAGVASRTYKELCLMDDLGKVHIQHSSHICQKILDDAMVWAEKLDYAGYHDWRLPTKEELETLLKKGGGRPEVYINSNGFSNTQSSYYWSSTSRASNPSSAWDVDFGDGVVDYNKKVSYFYVRCVRGGQ